MGLLQNFIIQEVPTGNIVFDLYANDSGYFQKSLLTVRLKIPRKGIACEFQNQDSSKGRVRREGLHGWKQDSSSEIAPTYHIKVN